MWNLFLDLIVDNPHLNHEYSYWAFKKNCKHAKISCSSRGPNWLPISHRSLLLEEIIPLHNHNWKQNISARSWFHCFSCTNDLQWVVILTSCNVSNCLCKLSKLATITATFQKKSCNFLMWFWHTTLKRKPTILLKG